MRFGNNSGFGMIWIDFRCEPLIFWFEYFGSIQSYPTMNFAKFHFFATQVEYMTIMRIYDSIAVTDEAKTRIVRIFSS